MLLLRRRRRRRWRCRLLTHNTTTITWMRATCVYAIISISNWVFIFHVSSRICEWNRPWNRRTFMFRFENLRDHIIVARLENRGEWINSIYANNHSGRTSKYNQNEGISITIRHDMAHWHTGAKDEEFSAAAKPFLLFICWVPPSQHYLSFSFLMELVLVNRRTAASAH